MQTINIFLGSSFHLMCYRKHIGETIRLLNEKWLQKGVRVRIFKWEDFPLEYKGKSKQQEYIDDLVLNSEICVFLFAHEIGPFTKRELEAKLGQDANAVYCYRVKALEPKNKKEKKCKEFIYVWHDEIKDELAKVCGSYKDLEDETEVANELIKLVEDYITAHNMEGEAVPPSPAWYFYTTIPNDNANLRDEFGDVFRSLDDFFRGVYGIRCVLHDREKPELLENSNHYVPLMRRNLSDSDFTELETAVDFINKKKGCLKAMTFFKNGKIYPDELRVKDLLDKNEIFPVTYKGYDTLKSCIMEWIMRENKRVVDVSKNVDTLANAVKLGNTIAFLSDIDRSGSLTKLSNHANRVAYAASDALKRQEISKAIGLQHEYALLSKQLAINVNECLNHWTFNDSSLLDSDQKLIEAEINKLNFLVRNKFARLSNEKELNEILVKMEQVESLTRELVLLGFSVPQRLLAVQMNEVATFDTYINYLKQSATEDALYKRIIDDADRFGLMEPVAEMMRMNYANSLSRLSQIDKSVFYYKQAIVNLKRMTNKSKIVWHNITEVYMHLCNLYADNGMHEEFAVSFAEFKEHVECLDSTEFLLDYCQFSALQIKVIAKYENGHDNEIEDAISVYDNARQKLELPIDHQDYGDVFVLFPNLIAAYYVDHCMDESTQEYLNNSLNKAEFFALVSLQNAEKLIKYNYAEGLFSIGEALHQLGFIESKKRNVEKAIDYYDQALKVRDSLFKLTEQYDAEPRIAQTLVNRGALLLEISYQVIEQQRIALLQEAMHCAKQAKTIYQHHIQSGIEMTECNYFEALQLEGTIYYALWEINRNDLYFKKAISCFTDCWNWNIGHPRNHYQKVFEDYSGVRLRQHGIIE